MALPKKYRDKVKNRYEVLKELLFADEKRLITLLQRMGVGDKADLHNKIEIIKTFIVKDVPTLLQASEPPMKLKKEQFTPLPDGTLTAELSSLGISAPNKNTLIHICEQTFYHTKTDMDSSEEDVYGWNFTDPRTKQKILIVND